MITVEEIEELLKVLSKRTIVGGLSPQTVGFEQYRVKFSGIELCTIEEVLVKYKELFQIVNLAEEVLNKIKNSPIKWSDKDNIEMDYRLTCFVVDEINSVLSKIKNAKGE